MTPLITVVITLLGQILPLVAGNSTATASIINTLISLIPAITTEVETLVPMVQNIIAALQADPATTAAQLVTLTDLDEKCDAAFEAAAIDPTADAAAAPAASS